MSMSLKLSSWNIIGHYYKSGFGRSSSSVLNRVITEKNLTHKL